MENIKFGIELEFLYYQGLCLSNIRNKLNQLMIDNDLDIHFKIKRYGNSDFTIWKICKDISIESEEDCDVLTPFEIISPIMSIDDLPFLEKFLGVLEEQAPLMVNSTCGFHVHISKDGQLLSLDEMKKFLKTYLVFEDAIDTLHHPTRRLNEYCNSLRYNSFWEKKTLSNIFRNLNYCFFSWMVILIANPWFGNRDYKINLQNQLGWRGHWHHSNKPTIEFRQHIGTFKREEIINWILLLLELFSRYEDAFEENVLLKLNGLGIRRKLRHFFDIYVVNEKVKKYYLKGMNN